MSEELRIFILKRFKGDDDAWRGADIVLARSADEAIQLRDNSEESDFRRDKPEEIVEIPLTDSRYIWNDSCR